MTELLAVGPGDHVLDVGTGSGYQAAVLAEIGCLVTSIERDPDLALEAMDRLQATGYGDRVVVRVGDGSLGAPDGAPWDGILVAAGAPSIPDPLREQLGDGRRLVIPVGSAPRAEPDRRGAARRRMAGALGRAVRVRPARRGGRLGEHNALNRPGVVGILGAP